MWTRYFSSFMKQFTFLDHTTFCASTGFVNLYCATAITILHMYLNNTYHLIMRKALFRYVVRIHWINMVVLSNELFII